MQAFKNFLAAVDLAGYVTPEQERKLYVMVAEFDNVFVVLVEDGNEEVYITGLFHKATLFSKGDFGGCPEFEGDLAGARKVFAELCVKHA